MVVISVYTYGEKIIKEFRWESGFLWGVPWNPPLCTNGSVGYLMQLSVNTSMDALQIAATARASRSHKLSAAWQIQNIS